jgi:hypothetical protein
MIAWILLLVGIGIALVFGGVGVYALYQADRARRLADESHGWASTLGTVVASRLGQSTNYGQDGPTVSYYPVIKYEYTIGGQSFAGEKITFGPTETAARSAKAGQVLDAYPVDKQVTVYYDPNNPSDAVLERRAGGGATGWIVGIVFLVAGLCFGCLVLGVGLFLLTVPVSSG